MKNPGIPILILLLKFELCFGQVEGAEGLNWINNQWAYSCDFNKTHFKEVKGDEEDCHFICENTKYCTHYAWTDFKAGMCWLKNGPVNRNEAKDTKNPFMNCGILPIEWNSEGWALACIFDEVPFVTLNTSTAQRCFGTCSETDNCTHFNWNNKTQMCQLMNSTINKDSAKSTSDTDLVCGVIPITWDSDNTARHCVFPSDKQMIDQISLHQSDLCSEQCNRDSKCSHFNWDGGLCSLLKGAVNSHKADYTSDSRSVCGYKTIDWNNSSIAAQCDFENGNLKQLQTPTVSDCAEMCAATYRCTHFVWNAVRSFDNCLLKTGPVRRSEAVFTPDSDSHCGILDVVWNGLDKVQNCKFEGQLIATVESEEHACLPACQETNGCNVYNWSGGTCQLLRGEKARSKAVIPKAPNTSCGVVAVEWNNSDEANFCYFTGKDLNQTLSSPTECRYICKATPMCTHYNWSNGTCYLKTERAYKNLATHLPNTASLCGIVDIKWNESGVAVGCKFGLLPNVTIENTILQDCQSACFDSIDCTYFMWNAQQICQYGNDIVLKSDAFYTGDITTACGLRPIEWTLNSTAQKCDFRLKNLIGIQGQESECSRICSDQDQCTHFSWSRYEFGTCWLKRGHISKDMAYSNKPDVSCGVIPFRWNGRDQQTIKCDFKGRDLLNYSVPLGECRFQCVKTTGCTHYSWDNTTGVSTCLLKTGDANMASAVYTGKANTACGVPPIQWNDEGWSLRCGFGGPSYKIELTTFENCKNICLTSMNCTHYSWSGRDLGMCMLKEGKVKRSQAYFTGKDDSGCGLKPIQWNETGMANNCFFDTVILSSLQTPDLITCSEKCLLTQGCSHYTLSDGDTDTLSSCVLRRGTITQHDAYFDVSLTSHCGIRPIVWHDNNTAHNCEFLGTAQFGLLDSLPQDCKTLCSTLNSGCTHYMTQNGKCKTLKGLADKSNAFYTDDPDSICGFPEPGKQNITVLVVSIVSAFSFVLGFFVHFIRTHFWHLKYKLTKYRMAFRGWRSQQGLINLYQFDAFLSYSSEDESWVVDQLIKNLENETSDGLPPIKLCIHERDFQLGRPISENIVSSLELSRFCFIVLSKSFCQSYWCNFEAHVAQHMFLQQERLDNLIIILPDGEVPKSFLSKTLKYLLKTKTYQEWKPDDPTFWTRLKKTIKLDVEDSITLRTNSSNRSDVRLHRV